MELDPKLLLSQYHNWAGLWTFSSCFIRKVLFFYLREKVRKRASVATRGGRAKKEKKSCHMQAVYPKRKVGGNNRYKIQYGGRTKVKKLTEISN